MPRKRKAETSTTRPGPSRPGKRGKTEMIELEERDIFLKAEDESMKNNELKKVIDSRYTGIYPPTAPQRPKRQHRWRWIGLEPLTDPKKLPQLWNCAEPDLADNDIEGQIQRCHERIEENIMPDIFRRRLTRYQALKEEKDDLMASEPGLEWGVVQRVKELIQIGQELERDGDPEQEIPNLLAIIDAYRAKKLEWEWEKVTYWVHGKQVNEEPQEFSWDDFERKAHTAGGRGFWAEGIFSGPGPYDDEWTLGALTAVPGIHRWGHVKRVPCLLDIPGSNSLFPVEFMDDTGAFITIIDQRDLDDMESQSGVKATVAGYKTGAGVTGSLALKIIELMITLPHPTDHPEQTRLPFFKIFCGVRNIPPGASRPRLLGPWLRHVIYTATSPDGQHGLYLLDTKDDFKNVPKSTIPLNRRWIHDPSFKDTLLATNQAAVAAAAAGTAATGPAPPPPPTAAAGGAVGAGGSRFAPNPMAPNFHPGGRGGGSEGP